MEGYISLSDWNLDVSQDPTRQKEESWEEWRLVSWVVWIQVQCLYHSTAISPVQVMC